MREKLLLVVGDKFSTFAAQKDVLTLSQLRGLLALPPQYVLSRETIIPVPGQGLTDEDVADVAVRVKKSPFLGAIDMSYWQTTDRADRQLSHKHDPRNIVISAPRKLDDNQYFLDLLVAENCDMMGDHQTGHHLQGMLLIEAARQALLAVTEKYLLPPDEKYNFVFNSVAIDYKHFLFPFAAALRGRLVDQDQSATSWRFAIEFQIEQAGKDVANVSMGYTVVKEKSMARMEGALAKEALERHFGEMITRISDRPSALAS